jgi:AraC-like DNA-binding protein
MPRHHSSTLHPIVVWPFKQAARELGLPVDAGVELLGGSPGEGAPAGERLAHRTANELLAWAVKLSARPDFGLLAAERVEPGHFELVELASRSQGTVGEALATMAPLVPLLHDDLRLSVQRGAGLSTLSVRLESSRAAREAPTLHPAGYDFIAASLVIAARRQTGLQELHLARVDFPYPQPASVEHLERFFGTPVGFDAPALSIAFPTESLDVPLLRSDVHVGRLLKAAARELLTPSPPSALEAQVRALVVAHLADDGASLPGLARRLHTSERTLRRRLQLEGIGFRELLDDVRRQRAFALLGDPALSTDGVAAALGFTTAQAFHRAFRRWTGDTVQAWRAGQRSGRRP